MCYISNWPKRFLKTILVQLSCHQVCMAPIHTHTPTCTSDLPSAVLIGPQERYSVIMGWLFFWFSTQWKKDDTRCLSFLAGGAADWKWSREGLPVWRPPHVPSVSTTCHSALCVSVQVAFCSINQSIHLLNIFLCVNKLLVVGVKLWLIWNNNTQLPIKVE